MRIHVKDAFSFRRQKPCLFFNARRFGFILIVCLSLVFGLLAVSTYIPVPRSKLSPAPLLSLDILDRHETLLREVLSDEGGRCRWVSLSEISPRLIQATIAAEDRAFPFHSGIDLVAIARAIGLNFRRGRVVSGASTITQQLVRNIWPGPRHLPSKIREAWLALRLERTLSKEEILVQYLNRIFYGNQAYGAEAASRFYFDKSCSELSLAEAAFLAALPRSPTVLNPYRSAAGLEAVIRSQRSILRRMEELGFCDREEAVRAMNEKLGLVPKEIAFRAPHFCDWVLSQIPPERRRELEAIQTTLDYPLQAKVESLMRRYLDSLASRGITNGAVVVLDNATDEVLCLVGSKDFFEEASSGQVNGVLARRQPGSALKPFTYALALEKGMTAASMVEDEPSAFPTATGAYMPLNYDRRFHGPMSLRIALACSFNVPAVSLLETIGPDFLYRRLQALGFESLDQSPAYYGIGLTLGNGEVTLLELTRAYAALARQGIYRPEKAVIKVVPKTERTNGLSPKEEANRKKERKGEQWAREEERGSKHIEEKNRKTQAPPYGGRRIFSNQVAYIITDILADRDARVPSFGYVTPLSFPFPVAAKTGTSKDFRDNWTVGYTPPYTVGVWVGNFDGKPMHNVSGITGCGPLFRDIMLLLHRKDEWTWFEAPEGIVKLSVCPESGELSTESCPGSVEEIFIAGTEPRSPCSHHSTSRLSFRASTERPAPLSALSCESDSPMLASSNFLSQTKVAPLYSPSSFTTSLNHNTIPSSASSSLPPRLTTDFITFSSFKSREVSAQSPRANSPLASCPPGLKPVIAITFPQDGDIFKIDPVLRVQHQRVKLRASVSSATSVSDEIRVPAVVEWFVNGQKIGVSASRPFVFFWNLRPGSYTIKARLITGSKTQESRPIRIQVLT